MTVNNCQHCGHKQHPDGGHCYMFRIEPDGPCAHHTIKTEAARAMRLQLAQMTLIAMKMRAKEQL